MDDFRAIVRMNVRSVVVRKQQYIHDAKCVNKLGRRREIAFLRNKQAMFIHFCFILYSFARDS